MFVCIQYVCVCRHENVSRDALRSETCFNMYVCMMLASLKLAALCDAWFGEVSYRVAQIRLLSTSPKATTSSLVPESFASGKLCKV